MNLLRISFPGRMKLDRSCKFGLFVMETKYVREKLAMPLKLINDMVTKKAGRGTITMCQFDNYNGN